MDDRAKLIMASGSPISAGVPDEQTGPAPITYNSYVGDVVIKKASNGFIVKVGCKTFVSTSWKEVAVGLELYWSDPVRAEQMFCK